jgi:hypothetical protein
MLKILLPAMPIPTQMAYVRPNGIDFRARERKKEMLNICFIAIQKRGKGFILLFGVKMVFIKN